MKIAIIGTGISGLTAAYHLNPHCELSLFEANSYIGGHTATIDVNWQGDTAAVDTGFIVFNDRTYPNFIKMMDDLQVDYQKTTMSFSVKNQVSGLEYRGADLNGFFAQRQNLFRPRIYRIIRGLIRFNKIALSMNADESSKMTIREFFDCHKFSKTFVEDYFLPMGSAIWSCPGETFLDFPIRFVIEFYSNHGLLSVNDRPQWYVIKGGSRSYIPKLTSEFADRIQLNTPVEQVLRHPEFVSVKTKNGTEQFDQVIFACHSDQALRILGDDVELTEREILSSFPYEKNQVILHTDSKVMPKQKRAWACWNYSIDPANDQRATVTYYMNQLQSLANKTDFFVTLNQPGDISRESVIAEFEYHHPVFEANRYLAQRRHQELILNNRTSFCGAYWGNGFHEDGVASGLRVAERIKSELEFSEATPLKQEAVR